MGMEALLSIQAKLLCQPPPAPLTTGWGADGVAEDMPVLGRREQIKIFSKEIASKLHGLGKDTVTRLEVIRRDLEKETEESTQLEELVNLARYMCCCIEMRRYFLTQTRSFSWAMDVFSREIADTLSRQAELW